MNEHDTLLVAKDEHLYFFDTLTTIDVLAGQKLLHAPLDESYWRNKLSSYAQIIFLDYGFDIQMAKVARRLTSAKLILFFWNHMTEEKIQLLQLTKSENAVDDIYTFDTLEAQAFGLRHNSTFYSRELSLPNQYTLHDVFFGASDNGRMKIAAAIHAVLDHFHIKSNFFILEGRGSEQQGYLTYNDYLKLVSESKSILEIMRPGQTGLTLRSLEALYFKKKLITTNKMICYYHFYHPDNIFIIGTEDPRRLPDFLTSPYQEVSNSFLDFYDDQHWAQRFKGDNTSLVEEYEYIPSLLKQAN